MRVKRIVRRKCYKGKHQRTVGDPVVGACVGAWVGLAEGVCVGATDGTWVGSCVGLAEGTFVGACEGAGEGALVPTAML